MTDVPVSEEGMASGLFGATLRQLWHVALICLGCAAIIIAGSVLTLVLSLLGSNDSRIKANLASAFERGVITEEFIPVSAYGHQAHTYDTFTECVALGTNFSNTDDSILQRIAASPTLTIFGKPCEKLHEAVQAENITAKESYLRFWHGYQIYMRPLLSVMSLDKYRQITAVLFFGVMIFFASRLARGFGVLAWPISLLPFFLAGDFLSVPPITSHAVSLGWIFFSTALAHLILDRVPDARRWLLPAYVFSAGMITNFVSFLLNPPLAPALIAFLVIAHGTGRTHREAIGSVLYAVGMIVLWYGGYAAEWLAKWALAAVALGPDAVIGDILGRIDLYESDKANIGVGFFEATARNLAPGGVFLATIILSVLAAAGLVTYAAIARRIDKQRVVDFLLMLVPLASIVVWVELNASHSMIHVGFVSRSMLLFSVIPLLAAILTWRRRMPRADAQNVGAA